MTVHRYAGIITTAVAAATSLALTWQWAVPALRHIPQVEYSLLDGSKHTTAQWHGRVMLVNFWATTCSVCVQEMPQWIETYQRFHARGLDYLAVAMPYDAPVRVVEFAASRQLPFPVAIDLRGTLAHEFSDVQATPISFLINRRGEIVRRYEGRPDVQQLRGLIETLLAES